MMVMACSSHQFGLCRQFTYWTIFPPTMCASDKGKQTNKQISRGGTCRGADAGGGVELCNMQSSICNVSEYAEELQRCIRDASEKCGVRYAGSYSDTDFFLYESLDFSLPVMSFHMVKKPGE